MQVQTVDELGRVCEYLEAEPYIASYVNSFTFSWNMNEDFDKCSPYGEEHGTLLDMAFIDRGELWHATREKCGFPPLEGSQFQRTYFLHDDVEYVEPGVDPKNEMAERKLGKTLPRSLNPDRGNNIAAAGPDGEGEDQLVKSSDDFNICVTRLMALLAPSLADLYWNSPIVHMPSGALEALNSAANLRCLRLGFWLQGKQRSAIVSGELFRSPEVLRQNADETSS